MKIVFAVIGLNRLLEEEVKSGESLKAVIARIAQTLYTSELADMILVYKTVDPFNENDEAVKKLQKGSIPAAIQSNLQSVTRNNTVKIQSCATNKVHFVHDVATRDASPVRFNYASERRYISTYCYCFSTAD
ncbi:hypothetical protein P3T76_008965 [Phytophthora citrophthora]|uniref:Uncharacterized protein n=1 Tax=Phytophthora citrophthora TaxID=4793 RepID=A0AAD9GHZ0_9STRA|nr:hypothetical protein P3T76_008965 [Phytophthora citrophthora]